MDDMQLRVAITRLAENGSEWAKELRDELDRMNKEGWKYTMYDPYEGPYDIVFPPIKDAKP